ncbi:MAG: DUF2089 domain-containing protein [Caulobacteraceae bacterium]|nr:DUF2089 domain-containing protein [Caulobacteraceae bacterium]
MTLQIHDWQALTRLTGGQSFTVERVRLDETGIAVEGAFTPPPLARLSAEDQVFVAAFIRSHGSIKAMEQMFGVSYPTIKARISRIAAALDFVETSPAPAKADTLDRLERGEINVEEAIAALGGRP